MTPSAFSRQFVKPPLGARLDHSSRFANQLCGFWPFNEYGGDIAHDLSLNALHGTFKDATKPLWEVDNPDFPGAMVGYTDISGQRIAIPRVDLAQGHSAAMWFTRDGANNRDVVNFGSDGSSLRWMIYFGPNAANVDITYRNSGGFVTLVSATDVVNNDGRPQFLCVSQDEDGEVELWHGNYNTMLFQSLGTTSRTGNTFIQSLTNYDGSHQRAGLVHYFSQALWNRPQTAEDAESLFYDPWQGIASQSRSAVFVAAGGVTVSPASLGLTLSIPTPSTKITTKPSSFALAVGIPTPSTKITHKPPSLGLTLDIPTPSTKITTKPSSFAASLSIPTPSTKITHKPASLGLTLGIPTIPFATEVTPEAGQMTISIPTPSTKITHKPSSLSLTLTIPTPATHTPVIVQPASLGLALSIPTPSTKITHKPSSLSLLLGIPTPTVGANVIVSPASLGLTLTIPTPSTRLKNAPGSLGLALGIATPKTKITTKPASLGLVLTIPEPTPGISAPAVSVGEYEFDLTVESQLDFDIEG